MKNILISFIGVIGVLIISSFFMGISEDIPVSNIKNNIYAFQIGAYKDLNDAKNNSGLIVKNGDFYYVYYSILSNNSNIEYMSNYLKKKNINFYLKEINPSNNFISELNTYENLMLKTNSDIAFLKLNDKILKSYEELE